MRSTLLFLAVLLACAPAHAGQPCATSDALSQNAWLATVLPATITRALRAPRAARLRIAPRPAARTTNPASPRPAAGIATPHAPEDPALLLHSPNAP